MRIPAPVYAIQNEMRYIEYHRGIPLRIRLFMTLTRMAAYFVFVDICLFSAWLVRGTLWVLIPGLALPVGYVIYAAASYSILDVFFHLGWRMFRFLLVQR